MASVCRGIVNRLSAFTAPSIVRCCILLLGWQQVVVGENEYNGSTGKMTNTAATKDEPAGT